ncbi:MAG: hypothetical protein BA866_10540 [Desulfobulbaceae bacterium S5133MH15]|nr:MAG: hypothetical protein BA866_10540 [Desulfobulbaceae bacterium S5133MH15]
MKLSLRKTLLIYTLSPILFVFLIFSLENIWDTHNNISDSLNNHMGDLAYSYANLFDEIIDPIADLAETNASLITIEHDITEKKIYEHMTRQLTNSHIAYGIWIAFAPHQYDQNKKLFAPYVLKGKDDTIIQKDFASYDYTSGDFEFWEKPVKDKKGSWTEPYLAKVGGIIMSSYVVPIYRNNVLLGVAGIDIPLHKISRHIQVPGLKDYSVVVLSGTGKIILFGEEQDYIGKSVFEYIDHKYQDTIKLHPDDEHEDLLLVKNRSVSALMSMLESDKAGKIEIKTLHEEENYWYYYSQIEAPGWIFAIRINEAYAHEQTYERIQHAVLFLSIMLFSIATIIFIASGKIASSFEWLIERCLRIERMNFQSFDNKEFNITEINKLSNTLSHMSQALSSHFNNNEESQIVQAIRCQTLPEQLITPGNYQAEVLSWLNKNSFSETYDSVSENAMDPYAKVSYLLLDSSEVMLDASIKNTYIKAIFSTCIKQKCELNATASYINSDLNSKLNLPGPVQMWMASIDPKTNIFTCLNLGAHTVLHFSSQKYDIMHLEQHSCTSVSSSDKENQEQSFRLQPGDILIVSSDGITGALNKERKVFGTQIIERILRENHQESVKVIGNLLSKEVSKFMGKNILEDDRSIMIFKYDPESH